MARTKDFGNRDDVANLDDVRSDVVVHRRLKKQTASGGPATKKAPRKALPSRFLKGAVKKTAPKTKAECKTCRMCLKPDATNAQAVGYVIIYTSPAADGQSWSRPYFEFVKGKAKFLTADLEDRVEPLDDYAGF